MRKKGDTKCFYKKLPFSTSHGTATNVSHALATNVDSGSVYSPVPLLQLPKVLHQCKEGRNVVLRALKKGKAAVLEFVVKLIPVGNKVECAVAPFVNQLVVENKNLLQCL